MPGPLGPDQASSWFRSLYTITEKSTPITMVFLLLVSTMMGWYLLGEHRRLQAHVVTLVERVFTMDERLVEMALRCGRLDQAPGGEGR